MGKWFGVWGVVVSITLTVLDFATHSDSMNPVCFFWCLKWAFLGLMCWIGCSMPDDK